LHRRHVAQPELAPQVLEEADLLAGTVQQDHLEFRSGDGQRHAGQARAAARVQQSPAGYPGQHGQRIQQVSRDHFGRVADRRQVIGPVPALQQLEIGQQQGDLRRQFGGRCAGLAQRLGQASVARITG
jgi:hypothetical protein